MGFSLNTSWNETPPNNKRFHQARRAAVRRSTTNIKVTGNAEPEDIDLPGTSVAFSRAATG